MTNLSERLAEGVSNRGVKLSYGEIVEVDGKQLLPVALVSYGFGAGGDESEMSGGGGGGASLPVGAYVSGPNGLVFLPNLVALLAVSIPVIATAGWALSRIIKAWR